VTVGLVLSLVLGLSATAAGAIFVVNIGGARDRVAGFHGRPDVPRAWRRNRQNDPRFWFSFGIVCLVIGLADLAAVGLALAGH
jgi:hypothetical protein